MNIPISNPDIGKDEIQVVMKTMKSGWVAEPLMNTKQYRTDL